ncbi:hypothetical protein [Cedecea sp.]|jgi:hypothetical protein|uniref:hypothetical protein n=1 Tax=Cedecea sp. TaxID=1970739 RepID=UPI002F3E9094
MGDFSELVSFKKDRGERTTESRYYVQHQSSFVRVPGSSSRSRSVIEQELVIAGDMRRGTFRALMKIEDMPDYHSEREAALKLAEWMQRMGAAIENYWSEP